MSETKRKLSFINIAHFADHYVLLIFPTVVIVMQAELNRSYAELIALSTACFVAFGLFSLPAGWIGDHWSRSSFSAAPARLQRWRWRRVCSCWRSRCSCSASLPRSITRSAPLF
jgi:MFS family permease